MAVGEAKVLVRVGVNVTVGEAGVLVGDGVKVRVKVLVGPGVQVGPQGGNWALVVPRGLVGPTEVGATKEQAVTGPIVTELPLASVRIKL